MSASEITVVVVSALGGILAGGLSVLTVFRKTVLPRLAELAAVTKTTRADDELVSAVHSAIDTATEYLKDVLGEPGEEETDEIDGDSLSAALDEARLVAVAKALGSYEESDDDE